MEKMNAEVLRNSWYLFADCLPVVQLFLKMGSWFVFFFLLVFLRFSPTFGSIVSASHSWCFSICQLLKIAEFGISEIFKPVTSEIVDNTGWPFLSDSRFTLKLTNFSKIQKNFRINMSLFDPTEEDASPDMLKIPVFAFSYSLGQL